MNGIITVGDTCVKKRC